MKKILIIVFIFIPVLLYPYTIEETLNQIESLKKELKHNEQIVEEKIANLNKSNPLFAEQDPFESDSEYIGRMSKTMPQISQIRKQYLGDLWQKLSILRSRLFETENIRVDIDSKNYDPNTEKWQITVNHFDYQKEILPLTIDISKKDAGELYENWDKVKKTGILAIDVGDKIGLVKLILENPVTQFKLEKEIQPIKTYEHKGYVYSVAFSSDGTYLAAGNSSYGNWNVNIYNLKNSNEVKSISVRANSLAFSPDNKFLAVGSDIYSNRYVKIYNLKNGNEVKSIEKGANSVAFSPDGKFIAAGSKSSSDGYAKIYNLETGKEVKSFKHRDVVNSVAFSPDGKFLAAGSGNYNGYIKIYNLDTGNEVKTFNHEYVNSVTFSPDGKFLAAGTGSYYGGGSAVIFNLETGNEIKTFKHGNGVYSVFYSFDGKYLATASGGSKIGYAKIFNLETGSEVKSFKHENCVSSVAFSPDGKYLATGSGEGTKGIGYAKIYRTFIQQNEEVFAKKNISQPPSLNASVSFNEPSGNKYLDALEKGEITVTVSNSGKGPGKGLIIKLEPERIEGLNYNNSYIEEIPAGKSVTAKIPIEAYMNVQEKNHLLRINFDEINGFPPSPVEIGFTTKAHLKPEMFIVDIGIEDNNKNGMIESGETTKLTVRIGNKGKGTAVGAYAKFYSEENVFITDSYPKIVSLGDLEYNQHIDIPIEFFVNDKAADKIPLYVDFTEATGISGVDHLRIPILKSERVREIKRTVVSGIDNDYEDLEFEKDLSIDIEKNIPISGKKNKDALAVIFGIENYRNVSDVNFAYRDAVIMKEYFSKTIGIPEERIYFRTNDEVTLGEFRKVFSDKGWLDKRVTENKTEIFFYYAGHGAPAVKEEKAFLIPFDGDPNYPVQTGYSLENVYENLSKLNAKFVTVFLDACFTGANRENEMLLTDARPVSIQLKNEYLNNVTVFSAASSNEISSSYPQNKHGLFSYFLMKGMQGEADKNGDKNLTIQELFDFTKSNVSKTAGTLDREQTPQLKCVNPLQIIIEY